MSNIDKSKDGNFYYWIFAIAKNYCISEWRKNRNVKIIPIDFDIEDVRDDRLVMIECIISEIEYLPEKYRIVIQMRLLGISFAKISSHLGIAPGTILQRYRDAIRKIRKQLVDKEFIEERKSWKERKIY